MFIVPRRGSAVILTLSALVLVVLLTACAQAPTRAAVDTQRVCPAGTVEVYAASGSARNAETTGCQSPSRLEAQFGWMHR